MIFYYMYDLAKIKWMEILEYFYLWSGCVVIGLISPMSFVSKRRIGAKWPILPSLKQNCDCISKGFVINVFFNIKSFDSNRSLYFGLAVVGNEYFKNYSNTVFENCRNTGFF